VQGYALFGHCIVIALTALFHPLHDHLYFFALLALFAGASCLRMVGTFVCSTMVRLNVRVLQGIIFASKARHRTHKLILLITITILHCTFLAYLHFGFETMVEGRVHVHVPASLSPLFTTKHIVAQVGNETLDELLQKSMTSLATTVRRVYRAL